MNKLAAVIAMLVLTGCTNTEGLFQSGKEVAGNLVINTERVLCRAQTIGAVVDRYWDGSKLNEHYTELCKPWWEVEKDNSGQ